MILEDAKKNYRSNVQECCERGSQDPNMADFYDNEVCAEHIGLRETRRSCDDLTVALKNIEPK